MTSYVDPARDLVIKGSITSTIQHDAPLFKGVMSLGWLPAVLHVTEVCYTYTLLLLGSLSIPYIQCLQVGSLGALFPPYSCSPLALITVENCSVHWHSQHFEE